MIRVNIVRHQVDYNDQNRRYDNWHNFSQNRKPYVHVKKCEACKMVGEPFIGHELRNCPNVRQSDRANVIKSFKLEINSDELPGDNFRDAHSSVEDEYEEDVSVVEVDRVNIVSSPRINIRLNKTAVTMVLDTGATGSMIGLNICKLANLKVYPSSHSAILADGNSRLTVVGEIHSSMFMDNDLVLPINAVDVTKLKAGLIIGMDFLKENNVVIDIPNDSLIFPDQRKVYFNNQPGNPKVSLLRAEVNNIILPGESVILPVPVNFIGEEHIAIEPREENCQWLNRRVLENVDGKINLINHMETPIKVRHNQVIGEVRSVVQEDVLPVTWNHLTPTTPKSNNAAVKAQEYVYH